MPEPEPEPEPERQVSKSAVQGGGTHLGQHDVDHALQMRYEPMRAAVADGAQSKDAALPGSPVCLLRAHVTYQHAHAYETVWAKSLRSRCDINVQQPQMKPMSCTHMCSRRV